MTKKRILKGDSNFEYIVRNNGYFIDKTLLIKEFYENGDKVLVMPRPRRFGKTLNLSMIEHFFDVNKKESASLFGEFKISEEKEFCKTHQNQYPVINLSIKGVRGLVWEDCLELFKSEIFNLYRQHNYLLSSNNLIDFEKHNFEKILNKTASETEYKNSLRDLSEYLSTHFGKETIILLDEYDTPIIDGYRENFYPEIIKFMQTFLGSAFKGNPFLLKGLITGILRVAKESLFSEFNNPGVYTITSVYFADKFGFTEDETKTVLEYFGLQNDFKGVQHWYDGYKFGGTDRIYNPWSIVNYIASYKDGFKPYWINTGTDSLIKKRIIEPDYNQTYNTLQQLIAGETIEERLYENFVFSDFDTKKSLLWTLLTYSGYLTQTEHIKDDQYKLRIPNYEITKVFKDVVTDWWEVEHKVGRKLLEQTAEHLVNNRIKEFEAGFKAVMGDTMSFFDEDGTPEKVYQAYVLGLLAIIGDDYIIRSNRESGDGRYDILIMPHDKSRYGAVIEIKQIEKKKKESKSALHKRINAKLAQALQQIGDNQYHKELLTHKIKKIIKLPIVFAGKEPFVTLLPGEK